MNPATTQPAKRSEDLLIGALAVLALQGKDSLRTTDRSFHQHFSQALNVFRNAGGEMAELAGNYYRDIVSDTFDELDHALITAEQFGMVKFPNPSYSRLQVTIPPREAERILADWGANRAVFEKAAQVLYASMSS